MYFFRFWRIIFSGHFRSLQGLTATRNFLVTPFDCDVNLHMNNATYLKFMDLGRWDLFCRLRILGKLYKNKYQPAIVNIEISYKKPLFPGTRFRLETSLVKASTKSVTLKQRFMVGEQLAAEAQIKTVVIHNKKALPIKEFEKVLKPDIRQSLQILY